MIAFRLATLARRISSCTFCNSHASTPPYQITGASRVVCRTPLVTLRIGRICSGVLCERFFTFSLTMGRVPVAFISLPKYAAWLLLFPQTAYEKLPEARRRSRCIFLDADWRHSLHVPHVHETRCPVHLKRQWIFSTSSISRAHTYVNNRSCCTPVSNSESILTVLRVRRLTLRYKKLYRHTLSARRVQNAPPFSCVGYQSASGL